MAGKLGAFQTRKMNYVNGMVKENHIGAMFQKEPQKAPWAMVQLLERKFGKSWAIPADAEKPKDERIKSGKYIKVR